MRRTSRARRFGWLAVGATVLAIAACYGTVLLVGALSLAGVMLTVHEGAWSGAISALVLLAALGVLSGHRHHRAVAPPILALSGAALVLWAMLGPYDRVTELAGFVALAAAAIWDWHLSTATRTEENIHGRTHR